jgi:hypothetical protein
MDQFTCSGCDLPLSGAAFHQAKSPGRARQVASRCRGCRREDYYAARYPTVCACCQKHRPIEADKMCRGCLDAQGLRFCRSCTQVLPLLFKFYGASRVCKDCRKKRLTEKAAGGTTGA